MKYLMLHQNSFIRYYGEYGYITNQFNKQDRVYDEIGKLFLQQITREPKSKATIISELSSLFIEADLEEIENDFNEFIFKLEENSFVVTGNSIEDMKKKNCEFSYKTFNIRQNAISLLKEDEYNLSATSEYLHELFRQKPTIFGAHFEVTAACNERCIHCYIPHHEKTTSVDFNFAINILNQLKDMGTISITFSGGEPFLHPRFYEILQHARKNDFIINILTNGTIINKDKLNVLKELNIAKIQISLYSMNPEIHDYITKVKGSFEKTQTNILKLIEYDIPLQISCPIMKANSKSYKEVALWGKKIGIRVLSDFILMAKYNFDTSNLNQRLNISETEYLIKEIIEVEEEYRSLFEKDPSLPIKLKNEEVPICGIGVDNVCISKDGLLYPCAGFQGLVIGNANENSLQEIWTSSRELIKLRALKRTEFGKCITCEAKKYCVMCLVRNFNESNGNMFEINQHYCDVAFLTKKLTDEEFDC
jgi:radical SAM protein with 4Fe4S-binding SPASM domain